MISFVNMKIPHQFDTFWLIKILFWDIFMSFIISFIFYMVVEAPISRYGKRVD